MWGKGMKRYQRGVRRGVTLVVLLGAWYVLTNVIIRDPSLVPTPARFAVSLWGLVASGALLESVRVTVGEMLLANALYIVAGIALGVSIGSSATRRNVVSGAFATLFAMPKITLLPLFVLTFGLGLSQKVLFGALYGFFPFVISILDGFQIIKREHQDLFISIGARPLFKVKKLIAYSLMPFIFTGLRLGFVYCGIGVLLAEMYVSQRGLGQALMSSTDSLNLDRFWVYVATASLLLVLGSKIIEWVERRVTWWNQ